MNSILDPIDPTLPALDQALTLQRRAATIGFDWSHVQEIFHKLQEEIAELQHEIQEQQTVDKITDELGDLFFCCVNLARHLGIAPHAALQQANVKFEARFRLVEHNAKSRGLSLQGADLATLNTLWDEAKTILNASSGSQSHYRADK